MSYDEDQSFYIPDNIKEDETFKIPQRNLIETVVADFIVYQGIKMTPFIPEIKITATILCLLGISILFIVGIKGESITEFIITLMKYRRKQKRMRYRKCNEIEVVVDEEEEIKPSKAEQFIRKLGERAVRKSKDERDGDSKDEN